MEKARKVRTPRRDYMLVKVGDEKPGDEIRFSNGTRSRLYYCVTRKCLVAFTPHNTLTVDSLRMLCVRIYRQVNMEPYDITGEVVTHKYSLGGVEVTIKIPCYPTKMIQCGDVVRLVEVPRDGRQEVP